MKLSKQEKAAQKVAFKSMSPAEKLDYIITYYKWPIILALIVLCIVSSTLHRHFTKREPVLYVGFANVVIGSDLQEELTTSYLRNNQADINRNEIYLYQSLYLSDSADEMNHEYAYASRIKVTASIQAKKLDVVIMNRESYDFFSGKGYLLDFTVATDIDEKVLPYIVSNAVIIEDNAIDHLLNEAVSHEVVTKDVCNGIELTELPAFQRAGFDTPLYLGVIANSPRMEEAMGYIHFLLEEP